MNKTITRIILLGTTLLLISLMGCRSQSSSEIFTGANSATSQQAELLAEKWQLIGSGTYTYILFRIYHVKLYGKNAQIDNTTIPKIITLDYVRDIDAQVSREANNKAILLNTSKYALVKHQDDWNTLNAFIEPIAAGQSLIIKHDNNGLTLSYPHLDKTLSITNPQLAQFYIDIWLGEKPIDRRLRNSLLGYR